MTQPVRETQGPYTGEGNSLKGLTVTHVGLSAVGVGPSALTLECSCHCTRLLKASAAAPGP